MIKRIDNTILLFVIGGSFNTIVGYGAILAYSYGLGFSPTLANAAGYLSGLVASYPVNKIFVFKDRRSPSESLLPYLLAVALSYCTNLAALHLALKVLAAPEFVAQAVGVVIYAIMFFIASRYWVFRPKEHI